MFRVVYISVFSIIRCAPGVATFSGIEPVKNSDIATFSLSRYQMNIPITIGTHNGGEGGIAHDWRAE